VLKETRLGGHTVLEDFLLTLKEPVTYNADKKGGCAHESQNFVSLSIDFFSDPWNHVC
jgi:hypothetical protein